MSHTGQVGAAFQLVLLISLSVPACGGDASGCQGETREHTRQMVGRSSTGPCAMELSRSFRRPGRHPVQQGR